MCIEFVIKKKVNMCVCALHTPISECTRKALPNISRFVAPLSSYYPVIFSSFNLKHTIYSQAISSFFTHSEEQSYITSLSL